MLICFGFSTKRAFLTGNYCFCPGRFISNRFCTNFYSLSLVYSIVVNCFVFRNIHSSSRGFWPYQQKRTEIPSSVSCLIQTARETDISPGYRHGFSEETAIHHCLSSRRLGTPVSLRSFYFLLLSWTQYSEVSVRIPLS